MIEPKIPPREPVPEKLVRSLGQAAYEAYCKYSFGISLVTGVVLPKWDEQNDPVKGAWQVAAEAAVLLRERS